MAERALDSLQEDGLDLLFIASSSTTTPPWVAGSLLRVLEVVRCFLRGSAAAGSDSLGLKNGVLHSFRVADNQKTKEGDRGYASEDKIYHAVPWCSSPRL